MALIPAITSCSSRWWRGTTPWVSRSLLGNLESLFLSKSILSKWTNLGDLFGHSCSLDPPQENSLYWYPDWKSCMSWKCLFIELSNEPGKPQGPTVNITWLKNLYSAFKAVKSAGTECILGESSTYEDLSHPKPTNLWVTWVAIKTNCLAPDAKVL